MRKWKDDGSHFISSTQKKIIIYSSLGIIIFNIFNILVTAFITPYEIFNIGFMIVIIWGVNWGGFYRLARRYAEWKLKKRDNKWR